MRTGSRSPAIAAALLLGCTGTIGDPVGRLAPGEGPAAVPSCDAPEVGPSDLRRLTRDEYDNTVLDLLGDGSQPARAFPPDGTLLGFAAGENVSAMLLEQYANAADALAATAVADLDALLPCDPVQAGEDACAASFVRAFGKRAYRRPLDDGEVSGLVALYAESRAAGDDFAGAIELLVSAFLQSPHFLYRVELGGTPRDGAGVVPLSAFELATRLSYFLWSTMPDDELLAVAEAGELEDAGDVEAQARRMLQDPRARGAVARFYDQWLELDQLDSLTKDDELYGEFQTEALGPLMHAETLAFVDHVMWEDDARLPTLLTASYTFVGGPLASLYGVEVTGDAPRRIDVDPGQRSGLLTQPGLMSLFANANQSSPVHRGKFVRERLLCQTLPDPPDTDPRTGETLMIVPPELEPGMTTRERFAAHEEDPFCAGCHVMMDPIGLGFEKYDAIGRYRTTDAGEAIDTRGVIRGADAGDVEFDGVAALAEWLSGAAEVRECMTDQWFRYAFGRFESEADSCSIRSALEAFEAADQDITELVVALTRTDAFLHRTAPEVSP